MQCPDINLEAPECDYSNDYQDLNKDLKFDVLQMLEEYYNDVNYKKSEISIYKDSQDNFYLKLLSFNKNVKDVIVDITNKRGESLADFLGYDIDLFRENVLDISYNY